MSARADRPRVLVGPYLKAGWSEYMVGAFDDFDALTFGSWSGVDLLLEGLPTMDELLAALPDGWWPDLFLLWRPEYGYIPIGLEDAAFRTAALTSDWYLAFSDTLEAAWRTDALVTGSRGEPVFRAAGFDGVMAMPMLGYQPDVDGRYALPQDERDIDVFCGGNPNFSIHQERARVHRELRHLPGSVRLIEGPFVDRHEFNRRMGRSRIFVDQTVIGEINMKVYEAAASATCLFVEQDNLDIRNHLVPDESVVLFRPDNVVEKILYYLEHEAERARIAERAQRDMAPRTYRANMRGIVERLLAEVPEVPDPPRRPIHGLEPARRIAGLVGYSLRHNGGKLSRVVELSRSLDDQPANAALAAAVQYAARVHAPEAATWADRQILQALAAAPVVNSAGGAYTWAVVAAVHLSPEQGRRSIQNARRVLESGAPVPFGCADSLFPMAPNVRFDYERTAWEALEAGTSVDDALRQVLLEDLQYVEADLLERAGRPQEAKTTRSRARTIRPRSWRHEFTADAQT